MSPWTDPFATTQIPYRFTLSPAGSFGAPMYSRVVVQTPELVQASIPIEPEGYAEDSEDDVDDAAGRPRVGETTETRSKAPETSSTATGEVAAAEFAESVVNGAEEHPVAALGPLDESPIAEKLDTPSEMAPKADEVVATDVTDADALMTTNDNGVHEKAEGEIDDNMKTANGESICKQVHMDVTIAADKTREVAVVIDVAENATVDGKVAVFLDDIVGTGDEDLSMVGMDVEGPSRYSSTTQAVSDLDSTAAAVSETLADQSDYSQKSVSFAPGTVDPEPSKNRKKPSKGGNKAKKKKNDANRKLVEVRSMEDAVAAEMPSQNTADIDKTLETFSASADHDLVLGEPTSDAVVEVVAAETTATIVVGDFPPMAEIALVASIHDRSKVDTLIPGAWAEDGYPKTGIPLPIGRVLVEPLATGLEAIEADSAVETTAASEDVAPDDVSIEETIPDAQEAPTKSATEPSLSQSVEALQENKLETSQSATETTRAAEGEVDEISNTEVKATDILVPQGAVADSAEATLAPSADGVLTETRISNSAAPKETEGTPNPVTHEITEVPPVAAVREGDVGHGVATGAFTAFVDNVASIQPSLPSEAGLPLEDAPAAGEAAANEEPTQKGEDGAVERVTFAVEQIQNAEPLAVEEILSAKEQAQTEEMLAADDAGVTSAVDEALNIKDKPASKQEPFPEEVPFSGGAQDANASEAALHEDFATEHPSFAAEEAPRAEACQAEEADVVEESSHTEDHVIEKAWIGNADLGLLAKAKIQPVRSIGLDQLAIDETAIMGVKVEEKEKRNTTRKSARKSDGDGERRRQKEVKQVEEMREARECDEQRKKDEERRQRHEERRAARQAAAAEEARLAQEKEDEERRRRRAERKARERRAADSIATAPSDHSSSRQTLENRYTDRSHVHNTASKRPRLLKVMSVEGESVTKAGLHIRASSEKYPSAPRSNSSTNRDSHDSSHHSDVKTSPHEKRSTAKDMQPITQPSKSGRAESDNSQSSRTGGSRGLERGKSLRGKEEAPRGFFSALKKVLTG
ncbi:hypothetical protein B0A49_07032 [Cryomyces minteri]|uniref:Uncharacterized protein n=1 Tax=Cryomyces minteri TaxID=331657 RepID=A0A4U0XFD1_9PEZI|nr:hypothetical protein B0A49_07032 [Cryomyces minteri]